MKIRYSVPVKYAIALTVAAVIIFLSQTGALKGLESGAYDIFLRLRGPQPFSSNIIIIEITDKDIERVGRWPWERRWHAALAHVLKRLGAKYIFFDIIFSEPSAPEDDALFSGSLRELGNVYLPYVFRGKSLKEEDAVFPLKIFSDCAKGTGAINVYPDADGILRRIPLVFISGNKVYYHIALKIAMDYLGMEAGDIASSRLVLSDGRRRLPIPLDGKNTMLINWVGKWKESFRHYSFVDVLTAYKAKEEKRRPRINIGGFKESICFVGITSAGFYDIKPTPLEPEYPAVGVMANAMSNIIDRRFMRIIPQWMMRLLICLMTLIPPVMISEGRSLRYNLAVTLCAPTLIILLFFIFQLGLWTDYSSPLLAFFGSYAGVALYIYFKG